MHDLNEIAALPGAPGGPTPPEATVHGARLGVYILLAVAALLLLAFGLYLRARGRENHVALSASPKPVTVRKAPAGSYREGRSYVGTLAPWVRARVGPQHVSAYAGAVLVRPGDAVKAGQVLATLDCRGASAETQATAARARALAERQGALAGELARTQQMAEGGFTAPSDLERLSARSGAAAAELAAMRASLQVRSLAVDDCVLRAPFSGEIAERLADPGAYVRPGSPVVKLIDRSTVRATASAPESDFELLAPGRAVDIAVVATGQRVRGEISRRAPGADSATRTVDFEVDLKNDDRALPSNGTAVLGLSAGEPRPAAVVPASSATVQGRGASLFVVQEGRARRVVAPVLGEIEGQVYLDPAQLPPGSAVVTAGRALLQDGDAVAATEEAP